MHALHEFSIALIIMLYSGISVQFLYQAGAVGYSTKAGRATLYLMSIFILCALCGYVPRLFDSYPEWLNTAAHFFLVFFSGLFMATNQIGLITIALQEAKESHDT